MNSVCLPVGRGARRAVLRRGLRGKTGQRQVDISPDQGVQPFDDRRGFLLHATDVKGQGDEAWIGEWTVKQSNLSGNGKVQNTAAKTANLQQQLEQFRMKT